MRLIVLTLTLCVVIVKGSQCPLGFVSLDSSCYLFSHTTATFAEANSLCRYLGSSLAAITTWKENSLVTGYLLRKGFGKRYWIAGTDIRVENNWVLENPIRMMTYTNWEPGEPGNHGGQESCILMHPTFNYRWVDTSCAYRYRFICEKNL